ncbi:MAG: HAMP domain-containing protein [Ruminococcaceae bacterium]|jgi:methyl-accepting chemotaxis protein|nr:HAMP domain-containing protein [Oscillospiraceae bacterium]
MKKLKELKIKQKLAGSFITMIILILILSFISVFAMNRLVNTEAEMQGRMDSLPVLTEVMQDSLSIQSVGNAAVLNGNNASEYQELTKRLDTYTADYKTKHAALMQTVKTAEWHEKLNAAEKLYENSYEPKLKQAIEAAQGAGSTSSASSLLKEASTVGDQILNTYQQFMSVRQQNSKTSYDENTAETRIIFIVILIIVAFSLVVAVTLEVRITKSISKPLNELSDSAVQLSYGNLKARSNYISEDEIGVASAALNDSFASLQDVVSEVSQILEDISKGKYDHTEVRTYKGDFAPISKALNIILNNLNEIFTSINESAAQVESGSSEVANGAQALAQGATEQASSVEELSSQIEEVSKKVQENSTGITAIASEMNSAASQAETGNEQMNEMLTAMNNIATSSEEIGKIIKVIDNIAFQTNILALNASVEAARAGAAGKGFAVVAEEVRNLASRSADAAKQTSVLIASSTGKVQDGLTLADNTAKALSEIAESIQTINTKINDIENASTAQATAISQINLGVEQVSAVIQTNSATAQQSAAASEELSKQAENLKGEINWIQLRK